VKYLFIPNVFDSDSRSGVAIEETSETAGSSNSWKHCDINPSKKHIDKKKERKKEKAKATKI